MNKLLMFAGLSEIGFGLMLLAAPELAARLLLAISISGTSLIVARIAGACLIALGIGCWPRGGSRRGLYVMLTYSALAACGLVVVGLRGPVGVLLWPAAVVHGAVAILLWSNRQRSEPLH